MTQLSNDSLRPQSGLGKLAARKAGHSTIAVVVCIVIWALSNNASGYFWPGWVILIASLDFLVNVGKAALGDAKERAKLEKQYGDAQ
jgi:hypothetical protein